MELAIRDLPVAQAEKIRGQMCQILKSALPPKSDVTGPEWKALQSIWKDKSLIVCIKWLYLPLSLLENELVNLWLFDACLLFSPKM